MTRPLLIVTSAFVLSRIVYLLMGVRFDSTPLDSFWQYIDPVLLKTHLVQSLYYLHSQPPLFNLYLGIVLKLFGASAPGAFYISFLVMGLIINAGMFVILDNLGVSRRISLTLVLLFMISPASILYENFLFYTYPVTTMLVLSALFLQKYTIIRRTGWLAGFFVLLMLLVYTRSAFHLVWFAVVIVALLIFRKRYRRQILISASIPFILCVLLYAKNAALFGTFGSSSWFGMNFARLTTWQLPVDTRYELIDKGKLSTLSLVKPFRSLDTYERHSRISLAPATGIPVLDDQVKSTGEPNLNNETYLGISGTYAADAKYVLIHYPAIYLSSVAEAFMIYGVPASSYSFLGENRAKLKPVDRAFNTVLYGQFIYEDPITDSRVFFNTGLFIMAIYLLLLVYSFIWLKRQNWREDDGGNKAIVVGFIWLTALYVTVVANVFELGENNRFRFMTDPFFFLLLGIALQAILPRRLNRSAS